MVHKLVERFLPLAGGKKGAEPGVANFDTADSQHRFQDGRIARVFAAHFAAGKARQRHFADGLLEGVFAAELRHIVIRPADRSDGEPYVLLIHNAPLWQTAAAQRPSSSRSISSRVSTAWYFIFSG